MADDRWKTWRGDCRQRDFTRIRVGTGFTSIPGVFTIEVNHFDWPRPIAIVWWRFSGSDGVDVLDSLVQSRLRRCGLRTLLNEFLFRFYPQVQVIRTPDGTRSGLAWMKAVGYRKTDSGWEFRRKVKAATKRRRSA